MEIKQEENGDNGRFYIEQDNKTVGEILYTWRSPDRIVINHTEVGPELKGKGAGKLLVAEVVKFARQENIKIIPMCVFAKSVFDKTPEYKDVL